MTPPTLLSLQVSLPRTHTVDQAAWLTGYFKQPVNGPLHVDFERLAGDGVQNLGAHGGPDRVVLAYAAEHYLAWRGEFVDHELPYGAFGENMTVSGLSEATVCIGDRHHVGSAVLEVAIPRSPCPSIARANALPGLFERVRESGRIGWLYRVIQPGELAAGQAIGVEPGPHAGWSVARTYEVFTRARKRDASVLEAAAELRDLDRLARVWRDILTQALAGPGLPTA